MVWSCHWHGVSGVLEEVRKEAIREFSVMGPVEAGKRYTALRKTGGSEEWGWSLAPMNVFAPDGSMNWEGKVMWAKDPNVSMAQPPTEAWYEVKGDLLCLVLE